MVSDSQDKEADKLAEQDEEGKDFPVVTGDLQNPVERGETASPDEPGGEARNYGTRPAE